MELIIITGMSGAGKSRVIDTMEDIGFYCVDNMPAKLISKFTELAKQSDGSISKMAVVVDARGGTMFRDLCDELDALEKSKHAASIRCSTPTRLRWNRPFSRRDCCWPTPATARTTSSIRPI